jgi:outer membrane protein W
MRPLHEINIRRRYTMCNKLCSAVLVLFFVLGISVGVYAQQPGQEKAKGPSAPDPKSYFVLKGGIFYPQGDLKELNTGFNGEFAYGYRFNKNLAFELGSGYMQVGKTYRTAVDGTALSLKESVYAIPLTLTVKGILPLNKAFEVYGLVGGGGYYIHNRSTFSDADLGRFSGTGHSLTYGGFAGIGANYNITREWFVGLEGKYLVTDRPKITTNIAGVAADTNFRLQGIQTTANIGYRF